MRVFVVIAILAFAPVAVAIQNQPSSAQDRQKAQQANPIAPISVNCNCTAQTDDSKNKPQGWHKLVTWPEGVATWALLFTLGAILWQAVETRRSVKLATKALIIDFRPKIIIRSIKLNPPDTASYDQRGVMNWDILINVTNIGGTEAKVRKYEALFEIYEAVGILAGVPLFYTDWSPDYDHEFVLAPGKQYILRGRIADGQSFRDNLHSIELSAKNHKTELHPTCLGRIIYVDGNGLERTTAFMREWNVGSQRFAPIDDPEYEYQD
jgi:hypothetical protein